MDRYSTNQNGTSPALSALINEFASMPRSAFDETRRKSLDVAPFAIIPIECFLMFPNSQAYLNYDISAITKNPTIKRMLSSMTIETRTYKVKCSDLWEGWNNFITKGRTGKVDLQIPKLAFVHQQYDPAVTGSHLIHTSLPYNPAHYLNIAPAYQFATNQSFKDNQGFYSQENIDNYDTTDLLSSNFSITQSTSYNSINALPFVMYNKICKEYFNSNLLQENHNWYPENENHDNILPYNASVVYNSTYDYCSTPYNEQLLIQPSEDNDSYPWLNILYYKQRKGNYFNTGSPFPDLIRGDVPTLDLGGNANVIYPDNLFSDQSGIGLPYVLNLLIAGDPAYNKLSAGSLSFDSVNNQVQVSYNNTDSQLFKTLLEKGTVNLSNLQMSLNQWRWLTTMTVFKERMARTDGSYNQMIQAQFKHNPRWHEHNVVYCGGSSQPVVFSEVVQNSADGDTPLGTTAGRAVSSSYNEQVKVEADDYTIFMTVLTITPDDYYSQGINRMWTELTQSEQYFPILNNLAPQAIKNKELFITGDDSIDEDVFNYQELFSHFKSRQNEVSGLMALPIDKVGDTGAYIFNRLFEESPQFNNKFVTGQFTDNENLAFASTEQAQFVLSIVSQMKYIAPIPAVTQPSDMGISY